jgi:hypothetical protein
MPYLRKSKPSADSPPPTHSPPAKVVQKLSSRRDPKTLGATSSAIALSIVPVFNDGRGASSDDTTDQGSTGWQAVYAAVRMVVEASEKSSDMFLPLKTAVGAVSTLMKNCDVGAPYSQPSHLLTLYLFHTPANN